MPGLAGIGRRRVIVQLAQQSMRRWAAGLAVVVLAISGLFGGLKEAEPKPTAVNTEIDAGPWKVKVTGARLVGELKPMTLSEKGNNWIVVLATVEITADTTWRYLNEVVQLAPIDGVKDPVSKTLAGTPVQRTSGVVLLRDAARIDQLNPGMPEEVAFFWELKAGSKLPTEVKVYIGSRVFREDSLTSRMTWMDSSEDNQHVVVPVVDRREATAAAS
jgi:hypothetical protein